MSCTLNNPLTGDKSQLHEQLKSIFKNEDQAEVAYLKLRGSSFKGRFGDWESVHETSMKKLGQTSIVFEEEKTTMKIGRVNPKTGEPLLIQDADSKQWYYIDKNNDRDYLDKMRLSQFTATQIKEVTNHLMYRFVLEGGKDSLNNYDISDLQKMNMTESIDNSIAAYRKKIKGLENEEDLKKKIDLVEENKEEFRSELIDYVAGLGLKVRERVYNAEGEQITEVTEEERSGGLNFNESYETNSKDTATVNTKIMLAQIKDLELNEEGDKYVEVRDGFLGVASFVPFDEVWQTLNELLVDTSGYGYGNGVVDIFETMQEILMQFKNQKPWMNSLISKLKNLKDSGNNNKITEFVQAFTKTELNFFVTQIDKGDYQIINATSTNSRESQILNEWNNSFEARFLTDNVLKSEERAIIEEVRKKNLENQDKWNKANNISKSKTEALRPEEIRDMAYEEASLNLVNTFKSLGVSDIYDQDIDVLVDLKGGQSKREFIIDELFKQNDFMLKRILSKDFKFKTYDSALENVFNKESSIKALAYSIGFMKSDMSDKSVLLSQGKTAYAVSNPTYVSNKINEWKKDKEQLRNLSRDVSKKNSQWISYLLANDIKDDKNEQEKISNERLDGLIAGLDSSFTSKGKNDGVDNKSITINDQINANIVQMLNEKLKKGNKSYFPTIIAADKSRRILFEGFRMFESGIASYDGEVDISPKSIDVAVGYFIDEYNRMKKVNFENSDPNTKKVVHYHGEGKNGLKSQIFPEFDMDSTDPEFKELRDVLYGDALKKYEYKDLTETQLSVVKKFVEKSIKDRVTEHERYIRELDSSGSLSDALKTSYKDSSGSVDFTAFAGDYFMNGFISSVEYTKLFSGDPAFYKNNADLIKRIPASYTDGLQLRIMNGDDLVFNQATVNGVEVASRYAKIIRESVKDKNIADAYEAEYNEKGELRGGVNTTDAQAWITPRRWKFIKEKLGQWGPLHDGVYKKMFTGEGMSPTEAKLAAQPLKGVYFETNQLGTERPVYLKYSQAVLMPSIVKGTPMEGLLNKMQGEVNVDNEGNVTYSKESHEEIHEVVTIDGVKVGAVEPTSIHKGDTTDMLEEKDIVLNSQVLNNRGWKLQQDLPVKLMHDTNVGSQIQKNIFEGLVHTGDYEINGSPIKGKELAQKMHDTVSKLSNIGKKELMETYGIDSNGKMSDTSLIYKALIKEFKDRGGNENIVDALRKNMAFDAIPQIRGKVESIFMSIMNRAITKISTEGGSFIQVSPFGFETISGDSDTIITSERYNKEGLLPPRIVDGKVLPGQAMIPHSKAMEILRRNNIDLKGKDLKTVMATLDPSVLELITYRIPNQGMSSNDYLEIVGILPPGAGDSIIVYDGLPAKTGSDFDIDKLFAMQNHLVFDTETLKLTKLTKENIHLAVKKKGRKSYTDKLGKLHPEVKEVMYSESEIDKMLTQNDLVAQYKAVLNSTNTYDAMMRSIDGAQLKDDIAGNKKKGIKGLFPAPKMKNMELFSPLTQLKTKKEYISGKMGVGQTANQLVDHVMNQDLDIHFKSWIGVGNKKKILNKKGKEIYVTNFDNATLDENSIADNLSAFLNAYVDIAKDPYISRANHNSITANTAFMLLRAGTPLKWVNRFIGQPIIRELVELQMEQQSITSSGILIKSGKEEFRGSPMDSILDKYGMNNIPAVIKPSILSNMTEEFLENKIKLDREGNSNRGGQSDFEILQAWSYLKEKSKEFAEGVIAAKSDTAGAGGSNVERLVNSNKIKKVEDSDVIQNYMSKFEGTMLGTYRDNSLNWVKEVVANSDLFISGTRGSEELFNSISYQTGNGELLVDLELGKEIDSSL